MEKLYYLFFYFLILMIYLINLFMFIYDIVKIGGFIGLILMEKNYEIKNLRNV